MAFAALTVAVPETRKRLNWDSDACTSRPQVSLQCKMTCSFSKDQSRLRGEKQMVGAPRGRREKIEPQYREESGGQVMSMRQGAVFLEFPYHRYRNLLMA